MEKDNRKLSELVKKLQSGEGKAFEEIYNLTYKSAYFTALKICKKESDAEDVLQEAYMTLLNKSGEIKNPDAFMSWFNMVVANKSKSLLIKNNPILFSDEEDEQFAIDSIADDDGEFHPGEDVEQDELKKDVMELIDNLSDDKRTAVVLFYYDEMTTKQIAESLGINENTVKSRLVQAKKDLAKGVKELEKKNKSLYGIAPISLVLWALRGSAQASAEAFTASGKAVSVMSKIEAASLTAKSAQGVTATGTAVAQKAAKGGIIGKIAGLTVVQKITAVIVAASLVTGSALGVKTVIDNNKNGTGKKHSSVNEAVTEYDGPTYIEDSEGNQNSIPDLPVVTIEKTYPKSGGAEIDLDGKPECGDNMYFSFDSNSGTLTLSGSGEMNLVYNGDREPGWGDVSFSDDRIKEVVIGEGITSISAEAFVNCKNLKKVTIGKDVQSIGDYAFCCCSSLEELVLPDGVNYISSYAFQYCTSLKTVQLPQKISYIGDCAFDGCIELTTVSISSSSNCEGDGIMDSAVFQDCRKLTDITLPVNIVKIGSYEFECCISLKKIEIPSSVSSIGNNAFENCRGLEEIVIPDNVSIIGVNMFSCCKSLVSVTIPKGITLIDEDAFAWCESLENVNYVGSEEEWDNIAVSASNHSLTRAKNHYYNVSA